MLEPFTSKPTQSLICIIKCASEIRCHWEDESFEGFSRNYLLLLPLKPLLPAECQLSSGPSSWKNPETTPPPTHTHTLEPVQGKFERTIPESEFEKLSHFYDTRMTFRKQELKNNPHMHFRGKKNRLGGGRGGRGETLLHSGIHEYIIILSATFDSQSYLILIHKSISNLSPYILSIRGSYI